MRLRFFLPAFVLIAFSFSPGETVKPQPFLPELFAAFPNVRDLVIAPGGNELFFTIESNKKEFSSIAFSKKKGDKWSKPELVSFSGKFRDLEPALTADGLKMYFASARPLSDTGTVAKDIDIWYTTRASLDAPWSAPVNMGKPVNTEKDEFYPCITLSGNLYFTRQSEEAERNEDIYISISYQGKNILPLRLSDSINSLKYEFNAFVAPDESFILFSSYGRPDDLGGSDLYISLKNAKGQWLSAKHMNVNSERIDYCPYVDAEKKTLYFTSERSEFPASFKEAQKISVFTQGGKPNGQSRVYSVPFSAESYR